MGRVHQCQQMFVRARRHQDVDERYVSETGEESVEKTMTMIPDSGDIGKDSLLDLS